MPIDMKYFFTIIIYTNILALSYTQKVVNKREAIVISLRENQENKNLNKIWIPGKVGPGYGSPSLILSRDDETESIYNSINLKNVINKKETEKLKNKNQLIDSNFPLPSYTIDKELYKSSNEDNKNDFPMPSYTINKNSSEDNKNDFPIPSYTIDKNSYKSNIEDDKNDFPMPSLNISNKLNKSNSKNDDDFSSYVAKVVSPVKTTKKPKNKNSKKQKTTTTMNPNTVFPVKAMTYDPEINEAIYPPRIDDKIIDKTYYQVPDNRTLIKKPNYKEETTIYQTNKNMNKNTSSKKVPLNSSNKVSNYDYENSEKEYIVKEDESPTENLSEKNGINQLNLRENTKSVSIKNNENNLDVVNKMNQRKNNTLIEISPSENINESDEYQEPVLNNETNYIPSLNNLYDKNVSGKKVEKKSRRNKKLPLSKYEDVKEIKYESTFEDKTENVPSEFNDYSQNINTKEIGKQPKATEKTPSSKYEVSQEKNYESTSEDKSNKTPEFNEYNQNIDIKQIGKQSKTTKKIPSSKYEVNQETNYESTSEDKTSKTSEFNEYNQNTSSKPIGKQSKVTEKIPSSKYEVSQVTNYESTSEDETSKTPEFNEYNQITDNKKIGKQSKVTGKIPSSKYEVSQKTNYESTSEDKSNKTPEFNEYNQNTDIKKIEKQSKTTKKIPSSKYDVEKEINYETISESKTNFLLTTEKAYIPVVKSKKVPGQLYNKMQKVQPSNKQSEYDKYDDNDYNTQGSIILQTTTKSYEDKKEAYGEEEKLIPKEKPEEETYESRIYNLISENDYKIVDSNQDSNDKDDYYSEIDLYKIKDQSSTVSYGIGDKFNKDGYTTSEEKLSTSREEEAYSTTIKLPELITPFHRIDRLSTTPRPTIRPVLIEVKDKPTKAPFIIDESSLIEPTTIKWNKDQKEKSKSLQITITSIINTNGTFLPISKEGEEFTNQNIDGQFEFKQENCYSTTRSLLCCNRKLDELIEDVFKKIFKSKVHPCNFRVMARMLSKRLEGDFETPFEIIVGPSNFASKSNFRNDLFCKKIINDIYVLAYGTPADYPILHI
ncbi:Ground-like domain-containing protein [Strongyloides ratti]|uniref:Ground-like domain-containing protein n=1 Tax=Strongyloides ratti TaxID=34506 RepID=A0A090MUN2_STRRB|nr:Ground-like domain-containing protein [Strongyloides ratti]CEF62323.1 Ground-like domain-containing protein [Strongyloides ratti]